MPVEHQFLVYDLRADPVTGTDDAMVLVVENTRKQAERWDTPGHIWRYDVAPDGKTLINETYVGLTTAAWRLTGRG